MFGTMSLMLEELTLKLNLFGGNAPWKSKYNLELFN
jgi:hypothetical protein